MNIFGFLKGFFFVLLGAEKLFLVSKQSRPQHVVERGWSEHALYPKNKIQNKSTNKINVQFFWVSVNNKNRFGGGS
jgi:hypothetical protein